MKINEHAHFLKIDFTRGERHDSLHPSLVSDGKNLMLVDTGLPGLFPMFEDAIREEGFKISDITDIIITHADRDHIGSLPEFIKLNGNIRLMSHEIERPFVQEDLVFNRKKPDAESVSVPEAKNPHGITVSRTLSDGERLDSGGGIRVIHTPGHTPGHISLYLESSMTLVSGDALNGYGGILSGPNPVFTHDLPLAYRSLEKFLAFDIRNVICYHGGYIEGDIRSLIEGIIRKEF
jgi:glyoxylase-like metal-dependent hydrolase (beta-lactamase superfamily II)